MQHRQAGQNASDEDKEIIPEDTLESFTSRRQDYLDEIQDVDARRIEFDTHIQAAEIQIQLNEKRKNISEALERLPLLKVPLITEKNKIEPLRQQRDELEKEASHQKRLGKIKDTRIALEKSQQEQKEYTEQLSNATQQLQQYDEKHESDIQQILMLTKEIDLLSDEISACKFQLEQHSRHLSSLVMMQILERNGVCIAEKEKKELQKAEIMVPRESLLSMQDTLKRKLESLESEIGKHQSFLDAQALDDKAQANPMDAKVLEDIAGKQAALTTQIEAAYVIIKEKRDAWRAVLNEVPKLISDKHMLELKAIAAFYSLDEQVIFNFENADPDDLINAYENLQHQKLEYDQTSDFKKENARATVALIDFVLHIKNELESYEINYPAQQNVATRRFLFGLMDKLTFICNLNEPAQDKMNYLYGLLRDMLNQADLDTRFMGVLEEILSHPSCAAIDASQAKEKFCQLQLTSSTNLIIISNESLVIAEAGEYQKQYSLLEENRRNIYANTPALINLKIKTAELLEALSIEKSSNLKYHTKILQVANQLLTSARNPQDNPPDYLQVQFMRLVTHETDGRPSVGRKILNALVGFAGALLAVIPLSLCLLGRAVSFGIVKQSFTRGVIASAALLSKSAQTLFSPHSGKLKQAEEFAQAIENSRSTVVEESQQLPQKEVPPPNYQERQRLFCLPPLYSPPPLLLPEYVEQSPEYVEKPHTP